MARIILIHGGLHGGWCWERVTPLLEAAGHEVLAPDLPGVDRRLPATEVTLQSYVDAILALAEPRGGRVVLVGHSLGGRSISVAADQRPDLLDALVYVAALIPEIEGLGPTFTPGENNVIRRGFYPVDGGASMMVEAAAARRGFYSDCSEADILKAIERLAPQPNRPMADPVLLSPSRWGRIPRHYVVTLHDAVIPAAAQREMAQMAAGTRIHELPCGHSPFLTHPGELTRILLDVAAEDGPGQVSPRPAA